MHHCASFSQQYCEDVNNDENSEIAACDKNDWVISSLHRIDGVWARVFGQFRSFDVISGHFLVILGRNNG